MVSRLRAGDLAAFESIYDRYIRRLFSLCLGMLRDRAEAEDATQQVFLDAYSSITTGSNEIRLSPWLKRIARNECLSRLRSRRPTTNVDVETLVQSVTSEAEGREELRDLLRDLGRLPEEQSTALTLSAFGDMSQAEIGDVLDCDAAKVKSLVFRAHRSLAACAAAREMDCGEIRGMLDTLNGGSLRRVEIREHLRACAGCREHRETANGSGVRASRRPA